MSNASALLSTALLEKATKNNLEIGTMIRGNRSSHCRIEQNNDYNREIVISTVQNLNASRQSTHANKGAGHNGTPHTHTLLPPPPSPQLPMYSRLYLLS